jgi:hypothetical protein
MTLRVYRTGLRQSSSVKLFEDLQMPTTKPDNPNPVNMFLNRYGRLARINDCPAVFVLAS